MERVVQRSFKPSQYHTTGHTWGTFREEKCHHCRRKPRSCRNTEGWEGCKLRWIQHEMLKALNRGVLWRNHLC